MCHTTWLHLLLLEVVCPPSSHGNWGPCSLYCPRSTASTPRCNAACALNASLQTLLSCCLAAAPPPGSTASTTRSAALSNAATLCNPLIQQVCHSHVPLHHGCVHGVPAVSVPCSSHSRWHWLFQMPCLTSTTVSLFTVPMLLPCSTASTTRSSTTPRSWSAAAAAPCGSATRPGCPTQSLPAQPSHASPPTPGV